MCLQDTDRPQCTKVLVGAHATLLHDQFVPLLDGNRVDGAIYVVL